MAQCNVALEPTDPEVLEWTSDKHQREELYRLVERLPDKLLAAAGLHRQMVHWMTPHQQICFLRYAYESSDLIRLMGFILSADTLHFIDQIGTPTDHYHNFRMIRDYPWNVNFDRPRDPWMFKPQMTKTGAIERFQTIVSRRGVVVTLQDCSDNDQSPGPYLQLKYQKRSRGKADGSAIEERAVKCVTPFEDFCYPPDATMTIGFRNDGCIDIRAFAKEMPRSPVLHWIFPDPKRDDLDPAYRDFFWWL